MKYDGKVAEAFCEADFVGSSKQGQDRAGKNSHRVYPCGMMASSFSRTARKIQLNLPRFAALSFRLSAWVPCVHLFGCSEFSDALVLV